MPEHGRFIGGIAALIFHPPTETYLLLRRSGNVDVGTGDWESVTGRVQQAESFENAARREVREELGVEVTLDFIIGTSHFYRGAVNDENEVIGVRYACTLNDRDTIALSAEHDAHHWLTASEVASFLPDGHRVRSMIERAELLRSALPPEVIDLHRRQGFLSD